MPRAETLKIVQKGIFPLQTSVNGFLHVSCISPEQETTFFIQADVEVDDEIATTTAQAAACEEFVRSPKNRQQRRVAS